jgi:hypothetical protein
VWREPPPAAPFERVGLPRKRERRSEPADSLVHTICDCPARKRERGRIFFVNAIESYFITLYPRTAASPSCGGAKPAFEA